MQQKFHDGQPPLERQIAQRLRARVRLPAQKRLQRQRRGIAAVKLVKCREARRDLRYMQIFPRLRMGNGQQRPHIAPTARRDAAEAPQPAAAQQMLQQRLEIVLGRVSDGNGVARDGIEEGIALLPRLLLAAGGLFRRAADELDALGRAERAHKGLVAVGLRPAQAMVEVRRPHIDGKLRRQLAQAAEHCHGIRPAGNGAHDLRAGGKQRLPAAPGKDLSPHRDATPGRRRS